jgi:hypothetical protein
MADPVAGIPDIPGDPGAVRSAASSLLAASGRLSGLAHEVGGATGGLPWSGIAAAAARLAVHAAAAPLREADAALTAAAHALRRYASELEAAQREADRARTAASSALTALSAAQGLVFALAHQPDVVVSDRLRAQGRVDAAQGDLDAAQRAGAAAYERAQTAAHALAGVLSALAGAAPEPPPPPPPPSPPEHHDGGITGFVKGVAGGLADGGKWVGNGIADGASWAGGAASDAWHFAGNIGPKWMPGTPAFGTDVIEGAAGVIGGTGEFLWQGMKATSPLYDMIDPEGADEARDGFAAAGSYAWHHPWETGKAVLGIDHLEHGEPGKFVGEVGLGVILTLATGGGGAVAKGAQGVSRVAKLGSKATKGARVATRMRAATKVDDLRSLGKLDYTSRMETEVENFAEPLPKPETGAKPHDEWLVNIGDASRKVGDGRSLGWWVPLEDMRHRTSVEDIRNAYALPEQWKEGGPFQAKDDLIIARIPAGQETTRLEGFAAKQPRVPDPRLGGGPQIFLKEVDSHWIEARLRTEDFLAGHEPSIAGLPPRSP